MSLAARLAPQTQGLKRCGRTADMLIELYSGNQLSWYHATCQIPPRPLLRSHHAAE